MSKAEITQAVSDYFAEHPELDISISSAKLYVGAINALHSDYNKTTINSVVNAYIKNNAKSATQNTSSLSESTSTDSKATKSTKSVSSKPTPTKQRNLSASTSSVKSTRKSKQSNDDDIEVIDETKDEKPKRTVRRKNADKVDETEPKPKQTKSRSTKSTKKSNDDSAEETETKPKRTRTTKSSTKKAKVDTSNRLLNSIVDKYNLSLEHYTKYSPIADEQSTKLQCKPEYIELSAILNLIAKDAKAEYTTKYNKIKSSLSKIDDIENSDIIITINSKVGEKTKNCKIRKSKTNDKGKTSFEQVELDNPNTKSLFDYTNYVNDSIKPKTGKDEKIDFIEYLKNPIVKTHNIINYADLSKLLQVHSFLKIRNIEFVEYIDDPNIDYEIETSDVDKIVRDEMFDTDYYKLFAELQNFNGRYDVLVKRLYKLRRGIIKIAKQKRCNLEQLWNQARANLMKLKLKAKSEFELDCIECWKNILNSKYAFFVIMCGLDGNKVFENSFKRLISEKISLKLFVGPLYPISFIFTPFMCYSEDIDVAFASKKSYNIKKIYNRMQENENCDITQANWIYYLIHDDEKVNMIVMMNEKVLSKWFEDEKSKDESKDSDKEDDNEENEENNEEDEIDIAKLDQEDGYSEHGTDEENVEVRDEDSETIDDNDNTYDD